MIGGAVAIALMFSLIITMIGLFLMSFTNSAFQRYVSQNEAYTSIIILKKCIKAKVEIGLGLMLFLFVPVVYNLCQSLILIEDWDTTLASAWRRGNNHFVPCYFMAFPPFRSTRYNTPYSFTPQNNTHKATTRNNDDFVVTSDTAAHKVVRCRYTLPTRIFYSSLVIVIIFNLFLGLQYLVCSSFIVSLICDRVKAAPWLITARVTVRRHPYNKPPITSTTRLISTQYNTIQYSTTQYSLSIQYTLLNIT